LAEQVTGEVEQGEPAAVRGQSPDVRLDEDLDRPVAGVHLDANRRLPEIQLVAPAVPPSDDGMRHDGFLFRLTAAGGPAPHHAPSQRAIPITLMAVNAT
jgi:hypothetical protein